MKTKVSIDRVSCRTPNGAKPGTDGLSTQRKIPLTCVVWTVLLLTGALLFLPVSAFGQATKAVVKAAVAVAVAVVMYSVI